jgi:succinate dehydrogenase / fumarate reductase cytochrome b subunit
MSKIFSFFGLFPLGIYVVVHFYRNLTSLSGPAAFNQRLADAKALPLIVPLSILLLWVPIAFHGFYGLFAMKKSRPHLLKFPYFGHLKYFLQRLSGIGILFFIPAHVYKTSIRPILRSQPLSFDDMSWAFHDPLALSIYLLGILGAAYHLSNGLWQFSIGWGMVKSEAGMKRVQAMSIFLFMVLFVMGCSSILGFYL